MLSNECQPAPKLSQGLKKFPISINAQLNYVQLSFDELKRGVFHHHYHPKGITFPRVRPLNPPKLKSSWRGAFQEFFPEKKITWKLCPLIHGTGPGPADTVRQLRLGRKVLRGQQQADNKTFKPWRKRLAVEVVKIMTNLQRAAVLVTFGQDHTPGGN